MKYQKLGHTGLDVSAVACGSWQLGGMRWKGMSDEETIKLLQLCRDKGINLFDVSTGYGSYEDLDGYTKSRSQELIGRAFENRRDEVIINLKLGHLDEITHRRDFSPNFLVSTFKQSLKRLRTDYVDICLIHAPSIKDIENGSAIAVLQTLREQGLVGAVGYSLEDEADHLKAALTQDIDVVELQYNLLTPYMTEAIREAHDHGIGIMASGVYKRGILTGEFKSIDDLPRKDDEYWNYNLNLCSGKVESFIEKANTFLNYYGSPRALRKSAMSYVLSHPGVCTAVMGHRSVSDLSENIELFEEIHADDHFSEDSLDLLKNGALNNTVKENPSQNVVSNEIKQNV